MNKTKLEISSFFVGKKYIKFSAEYIAENILNREFTVVIPQNKVLTDITEFKILER